MTSEVTLPQAVDALVEINRTHDLDSLKRVRASVKGKITRAGNWIHAIEHPEDACPEETNFRLTSLIQTYEEFDRVQTQIERISTDSSDADSQREQVEDAYFSIKSSFTRLLKVFASLNEPPIVSPAVSIQENSGNQGMPPTPPTPIFDVRLPPISLPTFYGDTDNFESFSELFHSLVDSNTQLTDIAKFYYLRNALKGQASHVLDNISAKSENYKHAWDLLTERYSCIGHTVNRLNNEFLSLPSVTSDSHVAVRKLMDSAIRILRSLKIHGTYTDGQDSIFVAIIVNKLPSETRQQFLMSLKSADVIPTFPELYAFIDKRLKVMEALTPLRKDSRPFNKTNSLQAIKTDNNKAQPNHPSDNRNSKQVGNPYGSRQTFNGFARERNNHLECVFCHDTSHYLGSCSSFKNLTLKERRDYIASNKRCFNCLSKSHNAAMCQSKFSCMNCKSRRHHTIICDKSTSQVSPSSSRPIEDISQDSEINPSVTLLNNSTTTTPALLSTAQILVADNNGTLHKAHCLLDSGSQLNFICKDLADKLHLPTVQSEMRISGVGSSKHIARQRVFTQIHSRTSNYTENIELFILPQISMKLPPSRIDTRNWKIPDDIELADPTFYLPQNTDILLGCNTFFQILYKGRLHATEHRPALIHTRFGWVLGGNIPHAPPSRHCHTYLSLSERVEQLWRLDECQPAPKNSPEELECEKHFLQTHARAPSGRFIVHLPFKQPPTALGFSRSLARRRWLSVENRLLRDATLERTYTKFMHEYLSLGHMELVGSETHVTEQASHYHLPHHPVFKLDSSTTRMRAVFDASAKSSNGISLNDLLMVGPRTQDELFDILLRFRIHRYVYTGDVEKMFRQILVADEDRKHQLILWRESTTRPLEVHRLNTITYGMASSPYIATRCLTQLAEDERSNFPDAAESIRDFYVDDYISGSDDIHTALRTQKQMIAMLATAGFPLRKWSANHPELLKNIPPSDRESNKALDIFSSGTIKALGLLWNPSDDTLYYDVSKIIRNPALTKRQVLSQLASLYDPLGLISPLVCHAKIFIQLLWTLKLDWDQPIPTELAHQWATFNESLQQLPDLKIPRHVSGEPKIIKYELHGFCDASTKAYGSVVYLRTINENHAVSIKILCAKSRVAPQKQLSIPRLELCAALLLVRLLNIVITALNITPLQIFCWSDSQIVLSWIKQPSYVWKTFVSNRIAEIQTFDTKWYYVKSELNPADLISRGCTVTQLQNSPHWWGGPSFLQEKSLHWTDHILEESVTDLPEQRTNKLITAAAITVELDLFTRFSSMHTLVNVTSYIFRFLYNSKNKCTRRTGPLNVSERNAALSRLLSLAQQETFSEELSLLSKDIPVSKKSTLRQLSPFIDEFGILRVGGRLKNTSLMYSRKHPIILSPPHPLTMLLIRQAHLRTLHGGPQLVLSVLRQNYWIVNGRNVIRKFIHKCVTCYKAQPTNLVPPMGELPAVRTASLRAFYNTGVDFAGPFLLRPPTRSNIKLKYYVAVFICMSSRAIHLELVGSLTAENFIATLTRFTARRGFCKTISSDNATTFIGSRNVLKEVIRFLKNNNDQISHHLTQLDIQWNFIPPVSPHWGGLWEAGVKSMKRHLKRVAGLALLNYEEFSTLLCSIEACLNSRPITAMSTDPSDLEALTPGHFLIGTALLTPPSLDCTDQPISRLTRWHRIQCMTQHFWRRWSSEYLASLQPRTKWNSPTTPLTVDQLVILKEDNLPPLHWRLGRIIKTHPGSDGITRVFSIKTTSGIFTRHAKKLFPLPIAD